MSPRKKEEPKTFEENISRLEEIVSQLERGDAALADSLALFEEGTKLASVCSAMLDEAEQKVVKLQKGPDGEPVELPFNTED
ncbi:MAG: exodeoxyribonuclease VII small subunit [Oscillibacter sp.]|nr:exodeoxyribonuclease VII small subunit [Oscillibacter sp.]MBD5155221.1 exodeoxyribonuclease VII small subunit [Oscillibacter sp.]